jgi:multiple sugar transport system substrate-binding protein
VKKSLILVILILVVTGMGFSAPTKVQYWYLWGGNEGKLMADMSQKFNASQKDFEVVPLEVPDMQKILVAISSGAGPDVTDDFASNLAGYASKGIMLALDPYISKTKYSISDFAESAMKTCMFQKATYALPLNMNFEMMFYNKKLFKEAGIKNPPATDKELLDDAIKLTKVAKDGSLDVLGFPYYPVVYYLNNMTYALGGKFISADGKKLTPDNAATLHALDMIVQYCTKFGVDNVSKYANAGGYIQPTDPFVSGKQAIRFDGPWMGVMVRRDLKVTTDQLDYGVAPLPYPAGHPELAKGGLVDSSILYIPANSGNKDGAWAFMSWMLNAENLVTIDSTMGNFPSRISSLSNAAFAKTTDFKEFADFAKTSKNLDVFPIFPAQGEYSKLINDLAEKVINLKMSPKDAMAEAASKAQALLNQ